MGIEPIIINASASCSDVYTYRIMRKIMRLKSRNQEADNTKNEELLIDAIREGSLEKVCSLLEQGCSANITDQDDIPGLAIAAQAGHTEIVEILLAAGACELNRSIKPLQENDDPWGNQRTSGAMAIWSAAVANHLDVLQVLDAEMPRCFGQVLADFCQQGDLRAIQTMLTVGEIHRYRDYGLLQAAIQGENLDIFKYLVESGVDVNQEFIDDIDKKHNTPLIVAAEYGHLDIVKFLVAAGASVDDCIEGETPLLNAAYLAAYSGQKEVFDYLCTLVSEEDRKLAEDELCRTQKELERKKRTDVEAFIEGAMLGKMQTIQWGIHRGTDINAIGSQGQTALMYASSYALVEMVQILLAAGADPNIQSDEKNREGETALMKVAGSFTCYFAEKSYTLIKMLVAAGADVDFQDKAGRTALIHAVTWGGYHRVSIEVVKVLVEEGANPILRDNENKTALMYAQSRCQIHEDYHKVVSLLQV
ncbi:MAG: ankyrin repeat domain-containing protein [Spirulinaceae cyanobacterium]